MKSYNKIFVLVAVALMGGSCNDWLDITPEDTTTEKNLFSTYGGYESALNGIYQLMSEPELYGQELTWGFICALGQYYDNSDIGNEKRYSFSEKLQYDTKEVQDYASGIWETAYNAIANTNNLIQHLEKVDVDIFPKGREEYNMILGESYAIRAMLHFDLLRLFAPAPVVDRTAKAIPYSTVYPNKIPQRLTTDKVLEHIYSDLAVADSLLTIYELESDDNNLNSDMRFHRVDFYYARGTRLNAFAVKALRARVYMYDNQLTLAFKYAKELYDINAAGLKEGYEYLIFDKGLSGAEAKRARKLTGDLIFAAYDVNLVNNYYNVYIEGLASSKTSCLTLKNVDYMFTQYRNDPDDWRYQYLCVYGINDNSVRRSLKYLENEDEELNKKEGPLAPVIRFSEVYHIMMEYYAKNNQMSEAVKLLKELRTARGAIERNASLSENMSLDDFMDELYYDVWKENIAEGQFFFYCKRLNLPYIINGTQQLSMNGKYVLSIPASETLN